MFVETSSTYPQTVEWWHNDQIFPLKLRSKLRSSYNEDMLSSEAVQESISYISSAVLQAVHLSQSKTQAYSIHAHNARVDVFFDELCPVAICNQSGFWSQIKLDVKDKMIRYLLVGIWKFLPFS